MRNRTIIAIFLAFFMTVGFTALWSAEGDEAEGDVAANVVTQTTDGPAGVEVEQPKKKGSRWGRIFKAPFKAVAKVFGGSGDGKKVERMTTEDAQRFESAKVMRVDYENGEKKEPAAGSAQEHLERGRAHLASGNLNEAVTELSRAASLDPRLTQAHSLLAVAFDRKGLHDRAHASYDRAADVNERDPQALNNLGYSLYVNGNYRAAVDKLKKAARLAPSDARIHNNLALAQSRLGKYDDAYKSFARAGGELNGRLNVAALLERAGRDADAAEQLERARRLEPTSTSVLGRLADVYERTGKHAEAQSARQALEVLRAGDTVAAGGQ
jgi:Flp pilus assembly protein TadD